MWYSIKKQTMRLVYYVQRVWDPSNEDYKSSMSCRGQCNICNFDRIFGTMRVDERDIVKNTLRTICLIEGVCANCALIMQLVYNVEIRDCDGRVFDAEDRTVLCSDGSNNYRRYRHYPNREKSDNDAYERSILGMDVVFNRLPEHAPPPTRYIALHKKSASFEYANAWREFTKSVVDR